MTAEDLMTVLGKPGRFQVLLYVLLMLNYTYFSWNQLGMTFMGAETKHHCRVKNKTDISRLVPLVDKDGKTQWDGCHLYAEYNTTNKIPCPNGWTYYLRDKESTVVAEWDLVCDDVYKTSLASTVYYCGVTMGGLVFGPLSDKFGRRPVYFITMIAPSITGLLIFFSKNYFAFLVLRFVLGLFIQGLQIASFVLAIEMLSMQYRTRGGILSGLFWALGVMTLPLFAFLLQDWRHIQLFTTLTGLLQIGMMWFSPESIRWLIAKKRNDEAKQVVKRVSSFNKSFFPRELLDQTMEECVKKESYEAAPVKIYTIIDIYRIPVLRKRSILLVMIWFLTSFGYYGLALNVSSFAGNKYLNVFISGIFELAIIVALVFLVGRFGRRKPLCFFSIFGGITCALAGVLPKQSSLQALTTTLSICGRTCVSGNFTILFIYSSELYPTVIRNVGFGSGLFWARFGSIVAPQIIFLGKYTADFVPFIILGAGIFVAGVLSLLLPETHNMQLPETIEDVGKCESIPRECAPSLDKKPSSETELGQMNMTMGDMK